MTSDVYVGNAGVAQRIRASDYGSEGWGFESLRPHHEHSAEWLDQAIAKLEKQLTEAEVNPEPLD